jgi:site-specific recombinase XerD
MMPKYTKSDIRYTIRGPEFRKIIRNTRNLRDKAFLSILYCTGARPSEVSGDLDCGKTGMTFGDIKFREGTVTFYVPVSKIKKDKYAIEKRPLTLEYDPNNIDLPIKIIMRFIEDAIRSYKRNKLTLTVDVPMFKFTRRTGYNIVNRAGKVLGVEICPYNFRHSRLTQLSEQGAGIETLMYFKGSNDIKSIQPYLHAKEVKFKLKEDEK